LLSKNFNFVFFMLLAQPLYAADIFLDPDEVFIRSLSVFQIAFTDIHREYGHRTEDNVRYFDRANEYACAPEEAFAMRVVKENLLNKRRISYTLYRCGQEFNRIHLVFSGQWESLQIQESDFYLKGFYNKNLPEFSSLISTRWPRVMTRYDGKENRASYFARLLSGDDWRIEIKSRDIGNRRQIFTRTRRDGQETYNWLVDYSLGGSAFQQADYWLDSIVISPRTYQQGRKLILSFPAEVLKEIVFQPGAGYLAFNTELLN